MSLVLYTLFEIVVVVFTGLLGVFRPAWVPAPDLLLIGWASLAVSGMVVSAVKGAAWLSERMLRGRADRATASAALLTVALVLVNLDAVHAGRWYFKAFPLVFVAAVWVLLAWWKWGRGRAAMAALSVVLAAAVPACLAANKVFYPDRYAGQHASLVLLSWWSVFLLLGDRPRLERAGTAVVLAAVLSFLMFGRGGLTSGQTAGLMQLPSARWTWRVAVWRLDDWDSDGFGSLLRRADCDDSDSAVGPLSPEIPGDGKDNNCLGGDAAVPGDPGRRLHLESLGWTAPRIMLVTVDALRFDALTAGTAPFLHSLRSRCVSWDEAYATYAFTGYSVYSLLHGRLPSTAGRVEWCGNLRRVVEASPTPSLPGELGGLGYRAEAIATVDLVIDCLDLGGFDLAWGPMRSSGDQEAAPVTLGRALEAVRQSGPLFLWVHFYDPHAAYVLRDNPGAAAGRTDAERAYLSEVYAVDRALEELWESAGSADTLWLFTGDHGEEVGSGMHFGISSDALHVPLLLCGERISPEVRGEAVSLLDVAPTLLHAAGAGEFPHTFQGESLLSPGPRRGYAVAESFSVGDSYEFKRGLFVPGGQAVFDHTLATITASPPEQGDILAGHYVRFVDEILPATAP